MEWLLCKDHSLLRPSWKRSEAVSDLCDHISMLQVNIYMLSVYRTAAGTSMYVCFKDFIDLRISFCFSVKLVILFIFCKNSYLCEVG